MTKDTKTLFLSAAAGIILMLGVLIGDQAGQMKGYSAGTRDAYREYRAEIDSLSAEYRQVFENPDTLGFVRYFLIPRPCPIIVNWNLGSTVSEQICENDSMRKVNTFKCLVNGEISLSWNTNNIIKL